MQDKELLNESNLLSFLQEKQLIQSSNTPLKVTQFSNGYSNLTYLLEIEEKEFVLRRPPLGAIKRGHDMSREFKVLSNINQAFTKAPKAFVYTEEEAIIGSPFYLMEKVEGIILTMGEAKKRNIPATEFKTIANTWMDTFVELHNVDYEKIGLGDLGRPDGYVERQVTNWGKQYLKAATMDIPEAEKLMAWMASHQPEKYDHCLIHNDFKYDNIVFTNDSWQEVNAVLDWEMCTLGDPLMDLGTSIAYWTMSTDHPMIHQGLPSPTSMEGNPGREEVIHLYGEKSGRSINDMVFYYVYGLFKIATIAQQIFYRYNKGLTSDPKFAHLDKAAQLFCKMAWQAIQKKRVERLF
ncbi:MAG: aminoglycoside phosphotransferase (APT) family kinase protein [Polaribacter sp.]|jgi:aminoglycoside phosphotransferase (APT) family kinase protein